MKPQIDFFSAFLPEVSSPWKDHLNTAANNLFERLKGTDVQALPVTDYSKRYFSDYLRRLHFGMECGCYLLWQAFHDQSIPASEMIVCDYGGGTGVISMLSKMAGIGQVWYADIMEQSGKDARAIARHMHCEADVYLHGEVEALEQHMALTGKKPHAVISRNVVEHIYDLKKHVAAMRALEVKLVYATTANPANVLTDIYTRRIQHKAEHKGFGGRWSKASDTVKPYFLMRMEMISNAHPNLGNREISMLAGATRGLRKEDILKAAQVYTQTGKVAAFMKHPTNTCHPENGNRVEHLMEEEEYRVLFLQQGYRLLFLPGFYDTHYKSILLNRMVGTLNKLILRMPKKGKYISPFVTLIAEPVSLA